jgi:hypothetical protein
MKKLLLSLALGLGAMSISNGTAHADLLTYFNFDDGPASPTTSVSSSPQTFVSDPQGGALQTANITTNFGSVTPGTVTDADIITQAGNTTNLVAGYTPTTNKDLTFRGGTTLANNGRYMQFGFSTAGYQDVALSYAFTRSGSGFNSQLIQYSTDGGTVFNTLATDALTGTATTLKTFNLSSLSSNGVNEQSSLLLRWTFSGATGDTGSNRFDNIQVNANASGAVATPEPETWAMMAMGVLARSVLQFRRKRSANGTSTASDFAI